MNKITPQTAAIITVALYGGAPKLDEIRKICDEKSIFMLEDNAECFGASYRGVPVGCYGDAASFSFQSTKHLTSGEGGILLVKEELVADSVRSFQSLGYLGLGAKSAKIDKSTIQKPDYKRHGTLGFNYRMPELCAAVALAQVERMEELVEPRKLLGQYLNEIASGYKDLLVPQKNYDGAENSYWTWVCKLAGGVPWNEFKNLFIANGGDAFYGAWSLTYNEPFITNFACYGRERFLTENGRDNWLQPNCPNADRIQPRLCQFQTNAYMKEDIQRQANALERTLKQLNG